MVIHCSMSTVALWRRSLLRTVVRVRLFSPVHAGLRPASLRACRKISQSAHSPATRQQNGMRRRCRASVLTRSFALARRHALTRYNDSRVDRSRPVLRSRQPGEHSFKRGSPGCRDQHHFSPARESLDERRHYEIRSLRIPFRFCFTNFSNT